jgi:phosphoribosylglycinamide formyltransferase-1
MGKIRIALFASGTGSNALNIADYFTGHPLVEVAFLLSNKKEAPVVARCKEKGIPVLTFSNEQVSDGDFLSEVCLNQGVDFIILAGYLRKIPVELLHHFDKKMINIHPSLLPKYGGKGMYGNYVHAEVLDKKEKETGITIHFVNEHFDQGQIIAQFRVALNEADTLETVQGKIQQLEHTYFPFVIDKTLNSYSHA